MNAGLRRGGVAGAAAGLLLVAFFGLRSQKMAEDGAEPQVAADPPIGDATRVRFIALGDTGKGNDQQRKVAAAISQVCATKGCDFALLLGDNLYPEGMIARDDPNMDRVFTKIYNELPFPFYAVLGNHDVNVNDLTRAHHQLAWAESEPQFEMPGRFYSFNAGPARFWALDTNDVMWHGPGRQQEWLNTELPRQSGWRVVFGHHPWKSNGKHGTAGEYDDTVGVPYVSGDGPKELFEKTLCNQADLYVAGHDHSLQLLDSKGCGTTLVVSGAGAEVRPIEDRGNTPAFAESTLGFAWIELGETGTVSFYGADAQLLESFQIAKVERKPLK